MSSYKIISVKGDYPFSDKRLELVVHKDKVGTVLNMLREGRRMKVARPNHDYIEHYIFLFQSTHQYDEARLEEIENYSEEGACWAAWYEKILSFAYPVDKVHASKLVEVFHEIETIKFPSLTA